MNREYQSDRVVWAKIKYYIYIFYNRDRRAHTQTHVPTPNRFHHIFDCFSNLWLHIAYEMWMLMFVCTMHKCECEYMSLNWNPNSPKKMQHAKFCLLFFEFSLIIIAVVYSQHFKRTSKTNTSLTWNSSILIGVSIFGFINNKQQPSYKCKLEFLLFSMLHIWSIEYI